MTLLLSLFRLLKPNDDIEHRRYAVRMKKVYFCLFLSVLIACSCVDDKVGRALDELDDAISQMASYNADFLGRAAEMRVRYVRIQDVSRKWETADSLQRRYHSYSTDSALFYLSEMKMYASTARQKMRTTLTDMEFMMVRMNCHDVLEEYLRLDTTGLYADKALLKTYISTGISLYHNLCSSAQRDDEVLQNLQRLRLEYAGLDSTSFYGQKTLAQYDRDNGDLPDALDRLLSLYTPDLDHHKKALTAYNIALIYKLLGKKDDAIVWLARSAENDIRSSGRDYLSLYELALMLYDRGLYQKANKYIEINLADAFSGNFNSRYINSGKAHVLVSEAERHAAHTRMLLMIAAISLLVVMVIVLIILLNYSSRQRLRIARLNHNLRDANKIKDSYVFRYMELSINYLDKCDDLRRKVMHVCKTEGVEAAMKMLRSPEEKYKEYEDFYKIFDETFLGLYPDFVQKVNSLLKAEHQFDIPVNNELRTELRMLAAIRIGITESGKISTFLKCSPTTIYTYRTRLHRAAICSKEEFEERIKTL